MGLRPVRTWLQAVNCEPTSAVAGNYNWFNLHTIALLLPALDDDVDAHTHTLLPHAAQRVCVLARKLDIPLRLSACAALV